MAVIRLGKSNMELSEVVSLGNENQTIIDKLCAFLLAISPILQHYRGFYENAGFSALLIAVLILTLRTITSMKTGITLNRLKMIMPLVLFEIYTVVDRSFNTSRLMYAVFFIWVFICISVGALNVKYFLKYASDIVTIAAILLVVQYISYYILDYTLNLRPFSLLVDQDSIWIEHSLMEFSKSKMYRPAAFFLEPSHLFLYSFPVLSLLLLSPGMTRWRMRKSIIVTMALLMSTSGMGVFVAMGLWGLYFLAFSEYGESRQRSGGHITKRAVMLVIVFVAVIVIAYFAIPVFRNSIKRVFLDTNGTNAIAGRLNRAKKYVKSISGRAILFGMPNVTSELDFNLAGFFATYIKWGIIGLFLTYWYYLQGIFKLKGAYFWISAIIIVISFFTAHTHGTFYMMYYVVFLANGFYEKAIYERGIIQCQTEQIKQLR